jgi:hypothetical protein
VRPPAGAGDPYKLWGDEHLFNFILQMPDREVTDKVVDWCVNFLVNNPHAETAIPVPGYDLEILCHNVPDTDVWVNWWPDDERRIVWLRPFDDPRDLSDGIDEEDDL